MTVAHRSRISVQGSEISCAWPTINTDNVLIKPFGKEDGTLKRRDVVQFVVKCTDSLNVFINAYEVDKLLIFLSVISSSVLEVKYLDKLLVFL